MSESRKAVVLLSGGLDSTTCLAMAKEQGFEVYALSFQYGQRHSHELDCAKRIAQEMGVKKHHIAQIHLDAFGGSALTDSSIEVPKERPLEDMEKEIPVTYVPARNTIFLSFALAWAEVLRASDIFIGVNALDFSGYPDCRPEYIEAYEKMANLATKNATQDGLTLRIHTPLIQMTKGEIVKTGLALGVDYSITSTCYDPDEDGRACGECDACLLRIKGFRENEQDDPAPYQKKTQG